MAQDAAQAVIAQALVGEDVDVEGLTSDIVKALEAAGFRIVHDRCVICDDPVDSHFCADLGDTFLEGSPA